MKKFLLLAIILFLLVLAHTSEAYAATAPIPAPVKYVDPFVMDGCEDVTQPCRVSENHTSDRGELSKPVEQALGTFAQAVPLAKLVGVPVDSILKWLGTINPASTYKVATDILSQSFWPQIHNAAFTDLTPLDFQKQVKENEQPVVYSKNGILCVSNPQTGESLGQFRAESIWNTVSKSIPGYSQGIDGTSLLISMFGGRWQKFDFNHPEATIKKLATPLCGDIPDEGQNVEQQQLGFEKTNAYGQEDPAVTEVKWTTEENNIKASENEDGTTSYTASIGVPGRVVQGGYMSYIDQYGCEIGKCTPEDIAKVGSLSDKQKETLITDGSVVGLYLTKDELDQHMEKPRDMTNAQEYEQTIVGKQTVTWQSNNKFLNRAYEAEKQLNCSMAPYKSDRYNALGCAPSPAPSPSDSPSGDVCEVAQKYHIPCCQLKGVMELETGSGTNMGQGSCGGRFNCCRGSACGPAQILCGQYAAFNGKDKLNMCTAVGGAELLARAMRLKLCQADHKCDTYDWTIAGPTAMDKKYDIKEGDYTATAYFYGLQNGCYVSACSQYRWGPKKGYCDSVASYCSTGKVLPDFTSPQFCADCNRELVRANQQPIQCIR